MAVYVDHLMPALRSVNWHWRTACHLFADTLDELHELAAKIGLKREWFQGSGRLDHYDLNAAMRVRAVAAGAVEVGREVTVAHMRPRGPRTRKGL
jgi:hypothetical protein